MEVSFLSGGVFKVEITIVFSKVARKTNGLFFCHEFTSIKLRYSIQHFLHCFKHDTQFTLQ